MLPQSCPSPKRRREKPAEESGKRVERGLRSAYCRHGSSLLRCFAVTQQADVAEFFREITLGLCSSLDLEVSLHRCLLVLRGRVPVDEIWANILDLATWTIQPVAMAAMSGWKAFEEDGPRVPLSESARAELRGAPARPVQRLDNADEDP
jgi:hypothetical protein